MHAIVVRNIWITIGQALVAPATRWPAICAMHGAEQHLRAAEQARRRAGGERTHAHRAGDRVRQHDAVADGDQRRSGNDRQRPELIDAEHQHDADHACNNLGDASPQHHRVDAPAHREPRRDDVAEDIARRYGQEPQAIFGRRAMHHGDDRVRTAANKDKECAAAERRRQHVADVAPAERERSHVNKETALALGPGRPRFRQHHAGPNKNEQRGRRGKQEDGLPAKPAVDQAADERRHHRRHRHRTGDETQHLRGALAAEQVADDGAADRNAGRAADCLQDTHQDQRARARRDDCAQSGAGCDREAAKDHRPPAEAVRQWSAGQLRQREADDVERDGELDDLDVRREHVGEARHGRHQNVERHRPDGRHRHQQAQQLPGRAAIVVQRRMRGELWGGGVHSAIRLAVAGGLHPRATPRLRCHTRARGSRAPARDRH